MEKKTIKKAIKATKPSTVISNDTFTGVHWDEDAIQTVQTVASALLNLTQLFKSQNITIEAMLKINGKEL